MTNNRIGDILKRVKALSPAGKRNVMEYLRFEEEKKHPWYAQETERQEEEYYAKYEAVQDLKQRLDFVIADVRGILDMSLPRDKRGLLTELEILTFCVFVATNKPYNLFDQDGPEYTIATNSVARCFRTLAKLRKAEKITDKESSMPEARSKKPHPDPIITPDPAKLTTERGHHDKP